MVWLIFVRRNWGATPAKTWTRWLSHMGRLLKASTPWGSLRASSQPRSTSSCQHWTWPSPLLLVIWEIPSITMGVKALLIHHLKRVQLAHINRLRHGMVPLRMVIPPKIRNVQWSSNHPWTVIVLNLDIWLHGDICCYWWRLKLHVRTV